MPLDRTLCSLRRPQAQDPAAPRQASELQNPELANGCAFKPLSTG